MEEQNYAKHHLPTNKIVNIQCDLLELQAILHETTVSVSERSGLSSYLGNKT